MMKNIFLSILFIAFNSASNAQITHEYFTLPQLQARFTHKNYTEKGLVDFQKTMENLRTKPQLHEDIPGEVISWYTLNGEFSIHKTFLIQSHGVKEVETLPKDPDFLKKLNSYVPEKSKFSFGSDLWSFAFVEQKGDDKCYIIKATVKSYNAYPEIPNDDILSYDIEYKTKDFKKFTLLRLKDIHTKEWTEVGKY